jgi:hypothetical protein
VRWVGQYIHARASLFIARTASGEQSLCLKIAKLCRTARRQPSRSMDAFSEILTGVKLYGAVFFRAEFSAPWGFSTPPTEVITAELAPGAPYLVLYHFVLHGGALVQVVNGPTVELNPGDIVVFPHGHQHHITSIEGATAPFPNYGISAKIKSRDFESTTRGWRRRDVEVRMRVHDVRSLPMPPDP